MAAIGIDDRIASQADAYRLAYPLSRNWKPETVRNEASKLMRGRDVLRWLADPDHALAWQSVLVPHMQTAYLERLRRAPTPWTIRELVRRELAERDRPRGNN